MHSQPQTPAQGAKYMLSRGMVIFPITMNSKVPSYAGWQQRRVTEDNLKTLPNWNFGVNLGATGHFVVDIDNKADKNGSAAWADLQRQHGEVSPTFTVRTPTGGLHLYFKGNLPNSVGKLAAGIDIRGVGGYVVAPGSEIDRVSYTLVSEAPIADAPQWVVDMASESKKPAVERAPITKVDEPSEISRAITHLKQSAPAVEGQGGDERTYKVACEVRDFGVTQEKALELMLEHFNPRCAPMWEQDALARKIENAYQYAQNSLGARTVEAATAEAQKEFDELPVEPRSDAAGESEKVKRIEAILTAGEYKQDSPPPRTEPVLKVADTGVAKPGDLVVLQAKVKAGKSAVVGAMMASIIGKHDQGHDYLGWWGQNPNHRAVLHFDTEQSPEDHHDLISRTLNRAGTAKTPEWFHSHCLTSASVGDALAAILYSAETRCREHGGIAAILIDGVGDLCHDVNDGVEANKLVSTLYKLAIRYDCPVVVVLHENPNSETGKTRGHLGSQLERKAASNLRLEKSEKGIIQLWGEKLRRGHIPKGEGPAFRWDDGRKMHVSTVSQREQADLEKAEELSRESVEFHAFLRAQPDLSKPGSMQKATEMNKRARAAGSPFGKSKAEYFVRDAQKYLAGSTEFQIEKSGRGETSYWAIERLAGDVESVI